MTPKKDLELEEQARLIYQKGLQLLQQGKSEEADALFLNAHQLNQSDVDILNLLGIRFYQKQDYKNALHFLHSANALAPDSAHTLNNLGLIHNTLTQFQTALDFCERAIKKDGSIPEAHNNCGNALKGLKRYAEALNAYQKAIDLRPNYAEAFSNQGVVFLEQNLPEKAIDLFAKAINIKPNLAPAHNNLGNAYTVLGYSEEAYQSFERALQTNPNYLDAYLNFGNSLKKFMQYEGAMQCYEHALKINPLHSKTFYLLGEIYYDIGKSALAKIYLTKSVSLDPSDIEAQYSLAIAQIPKVAESTHEIVDSRESFANQLTALQPCNLQVPNIELAIKLIARHPFYLAYQAENNLSLLSTFGKLCVQHAKVIQDNLVTVHQEVTVRNKLRIGIVSNFFCDHPVWQAITKGWVKHLNSDNFELYLFNTDGTEDDETQLAQLKVSSYQNCGISTNIAAQIILDKNLDILLYPEIGMDTTCKALACLRLAPIQITSWGHPETTGLPTIDYYLSSDLLEPATAHDNYSEKLIKLPGLGTWCERSLSAVTEPRFQEYGIDPNLPILICAGSPAKYTPAYDQVLIRVAQRLGNCQFIFFNFEENLTGILKKRLREALLRNQLDPDSFIKFIPFLKRDEFNGLLKNADLFLDTIGFSGFNTAMQAINHDLPVITVEGSRMRGRLASAILNKIDMSELICQNQEEYINKVVDLIQNRPFIKLIKERIGAKKHLLFDDLRPIRALEDCLVRLSKK